MLSICNQYLFWFFVDLTTDTSLTLHPELDVAQKQIVMHNMIKQITNTDVMNATSEVLNVAPVYLKKQINCTVYKIKDHRF